MAKYYGWIGANGYGGLVKIVNGSEAYVFNKKKKKFVRNDEFLKAAYDPGSEYDEISLDQARKLMEKLL